MEGLLPPINVSLHKIKRQMLYSTLDLTSRVEGPNKPIIYIDFKYHSLHATKLRLFRLQSSKAFWVNLHLYVSWQKRSGFDGISINFLKTAEMLLHQFYVHFLMSLMYGVSVLTVHCMRCVVPMYTIGSQEDLSTYRPLSILADSLMLFTTCSSEDL